MSSLLAYNVVIAAAGLVGGLLPLFRQWSERALHLFVAAATGVFLGATFVHLLPEFAELGPGRGAWSLLAVSVVLLFAIERLGLHWAGVSGGHAVLGYATFIGLAIHSVAAGVTLGVAAEHQELGEIVFGAIVAHKSVEAFSLTTVLLLAGRSRRTVVAMVALLALMVPAGTGLVRLFSAELRASTMTVPMAIGAGTFIYVSLCDLLPEVFHHREDAWAKVAIIVAGVVLTMAIEIH